MCKKAKHLAPLPAGTATRLLTHRERIREQFGRFTLLSELDLGDSAWKVISKVCPKVQCAEELADFGLAGLGTCNGHGGTGPAVLQEAIQDITACLQRVGLTLRGSEDQQQTGELGESDGDRS